METVNVAPGPSDESGRFEETANDRFKGSFGARLWGAIIVATLLHFGAIAFFPPLTAEDWSSDRDELVMLDVPPVIDIPPPPEHIQRPATPVISEIDLSDDVTIPSTTWEDNRPEDLLPPPTEEAFDPSETPFVIPHDIRPEIRNRQEVERALEREYPRTLKDAGIGGVVLVHFFVDEDGRVQNKLISASSGHIQLDEAAMKVAETMIFNPAMNRDERVAVWVSIPIRFRANR
jgi:periplasmic protein TonB